MLPGKAAVSFRIRRDYLPRAETTVWPWFLAPREFACSGRACVRTIVLILLGLACSSTAWGQLQREALPKHPGVVTAQAASHASQSEQAALRLHGQLRVDTDRRMVSGGRAGSSGSAEFYQGHGPSLIATRPSSASLAPYWLPSVSGPGKAAVTKVSALPDRSPRSGRTGSISGRVTDQVTNEALVGVNVYLDETRQGNATGPNGDFVINVSVHRSPG